MSLSTYKSQCRQRIDQALEHVLSHSRPISERLTAAMDYSVFSGGKRIRPLLAYAACHCVGGMQDNADPAACAVELVHAYSLVHDDLPAMDDDALRRGQPTCHKAYDEATAILVGDALQSLAFEVLSHPPLLPQADLSDQQRVQLIQTLSQRIGHRGTAAGQALDLAATGKTLNRDQLMHMHRYKTGALISASVNMGALCHSTVTHEQLARLDHYAEAIGLAFQVQDDRLDVTADTATLGKQPGSDQALGKPTSVSVLGLAAAAQCTVTLYKTAIQALADFDERAQPLRQLAEYIVQRSY